MSLIKNKFLLGVKFFIRKYTPWLLVACSRAGASTVFFQKERAFLKGKISSSSELKSVLFFAPERSATQYCNSLIARIYEAHGGDTVLLPNYFFHANPALGRKNLLSANWLSNKLHPKGFFYGCFGGIYEGEFDFSSYTVFATVRDPRDILVSSYYSVAYAHAPSSKKFAADAKEAREKGIDWYVTQKWRIEEIRQKISYIRENVSPLPNSYVWKYDEFMEDFPTVLKSISNKINPNEEIDSILLQMINDHYKNQPKVSKEEDIKAHRRSGVSQQYLKKLNQASIETLNAAFKEELEFFGF